MEQIILWDILNPNGIYLKGNKIKDYALKNLAQMHRIGEDKQIHRDSIINVTHALEYLKEICNFDMKEVI